jgi:hypothetical protein
MKLHGIWDKEYVQKLGILDHCDELQIIDSEIKRVKNRTERYCEPDIFDLNRHFEEECADLLLILSSFLEVELSVKGDSIVNERWKKFQSKAAND